MSIKLETRNRRIWKKIYNLNWILRHLRFIFNNRIDVFQTNLISSRSYYIPNSDNWLNSDTWFKIQIIFPRIEMSEHLHWEIAKIDLFRYYKIWDVAIFCYLITNHWLSLVIDYWDREICKGKILQVKLVFPRYFYLCPYIISLNATLWNRRKTCNYEWFRRKDWEAEIISCLQFVVVDLTIHYILCLNKFEFIIVGSKSLKYHRILRLSTISNLLINIIR